MQDLVVHPVPSVQPPSQGDEPIDVVEYLLVLWRRGWIVLGAAVLAGLAAFTVGKLSTPVYQATVKLIVSPPKNTMAGEATPLVSIATFRALVENQELAEKLIQEFKLDASPHRMTADAFLRDSLAVETVRDTSVVLLKVSLPSADLAAKVANRAAALAVDVAERMNQDETVRTRDHIKTEVEASRTRLDAAELRITTFKRGAQIEALKEDVAAQLEQRRNLLQLLVDIQTEKAKLAAAEAQLAKRERKGTIRRTIDSDPTLSEAAREKGRPGDGILGLEVKNEFLDEVYQDLDNQVASTRTWLSALEKQKVELVDVRKLDAPELKSLSQLYARETEMARLQVEYDLAKTVYVDVSNRYEQVRLQVATRSAQLQVMDSALPPARPIKPRVMRNSVIAIILGFLLSSVAVVVLHGLTVALAPPAAAGRPAIQ